jgi:uncharacterized protein (TIGR03084 family)
VNEIVMALEAQHRELSQLIDGLSDAEWSCASACGGWTVGDVILHLAQTDEMARASATHTLGTVTGPPAAGAIDAGADAAVAQERGAAPAELLARWQRSAAALCSALRECDPSEQLQWVAGSLAARTLATTRLAEAWIHTGDVYFAFGGGPPPTDRLWHIARLAFRMLPYAFAREGRSMSGPVAFRLVGPGGAVWDFGDADAPTVISGSGVELCHVASRRIAPAQTSLVGRGPDAAAVLDLVRTWA